MKKKKALIIIGIVIVAIVVGIIIVNPIRINKDKAIIQKAVTASITNELRKRGDKFVYCEDQDYGIDYSIDSDDISFKIDVSGIRLKNYCVSINYYLNIDAELEDLEAYGLLTNELCDMYPSLDIDLGNNRVFHLSSRDYRGDSDADICIYMKDTLAYDYKSEDSISTSKKENHDDSMQCGSCGKWYKKDSADARSIALTNLCTSCENHREAVQEAIDIVETD